MAQKYCDQFFTFTQLFCRIFWKGFVIPTSFSCGCMQGHVSDMHMATLSVKDTTWYQRLSRWIGSRRQFMSFLSWYRLWTRFCAPRFRRQRMSCIRTLLDGLILGGLWCAFSWQFQIGKNLEPIVMCAKVRHDLHTSGRNDLGYMSVYNRD